jgi:hypothetical protein
VSYPERTESSPHPHTLLLEDPFNIILWHSPGVLFPAVSRLKCVDISYFCVCATCHVHLILDVDCDDDDNNAHHSSSIRSWIVRSLWSPVRLCVWVWMYVRGFCILCLCRERGSLFAVPLFRMSYRMCKGYVYSEFILKRNRLKGIICDKLKKKKNNERIGNYKYSPNY